MKILKNFKSVLLIVAAAYIFLFAYQYYLEAKYKNRTSDAKWQYLTQVVYGETPHRILAPAIRWQKPVVINTVGFLTPEDKKTIISTVNTLKALTRLDITIDWKDKSSNTYYNKGKITLFFQPLSDIKDHKKWPSFTYAKYYFENFPHYSSSNGTLNLRYAADKAYLYIRTDSTSQEQRNNYILKGLSNIILHSQRKPEEIYLNATGQQYIYVLHPLQERYMNSVFNPRSENCKELTDIDQFILKTVYSMTPEKLMGEISEYSLYKKLSSVSESFLALTILLIVFLYFSGFFDRTIFNYIGSRISSGSLAFNAKVISVLLMLIVIYSITGMMRNRISSLNLLLFNAILSFCMLIPANLIYFTERVWFPKFEQFAVQQIFSFIAFSGGFGVAFYLFDLLTPFVIRNYLLFFFIGTGLALIRFFYNYAVYQKKLAIVDKENELNRMKELKTRAELNALQSKINPHFLYNALNSIAGLAHENAAKTEQMALSLSKLFRYSINKDNDDFTTVRNETEMVSIYLDIEKVRFGDKFQYVLDVEEGAEKARIPKFIIQPLVENAIKHGISKITGQGILTLGISKTDHRLCISVRDNGLISRKT